MDHDQEMRERADFVGAARSYIGTRYHHMGTVRGAGVDCATLLACAFRDAGLGDYTKMEHYPPDWHLHRDVERYLCSMLVYCDEVPGPPERLPLPGDVALLRFGRTFSHGVLVERWPRGIHAFINIGVQPVDIENDARLSRYGKGEEGIGTRRPARFFRAKRWAGA